MRVGFRVDASPLMGSGHVARCMSLADEMVSRGARTRFVTCRIPAHLRAWLLEHNHEVVEIPSGVPGGQDPELAWSTTDQATDARQTLTALADWGRPDLIVVDHYGLGRTWEDAVGSPGTRVMAIDDKARRHSCDLLVDQNAHANMRERYRGRLSEGCVALLGPTYALLRREFRRLHQEARPRHGSVARVFVLFGGTDPHDLTSRAVRAVRDGGPDLRADVVIGAEHPCRNAIMTLCDDYGYACHVQTSRVADLMALSDIAVGAGGSTSWERCCLGLPTLAVAIADNQLEVAAALAEVGVGVFLGDRRTATRQKISHALNELRAMPARLQAMSEAALELVDGLGCARVCDALALPAR